MQQQTQQATDPLSVIDELIENAEIDGLNENLAALLVPHAQRAREQVDALFGAAMDVLDALTPDHEACHICDQDEGHAEGASCAELVAALTPFRA